MAEPITLYKLMILSMLEQSEAPLTNTLLSDFFLGKEYTTYFTLQEALHELNEAQFIRQEASHSNVQYSITPAGQESLHFLTTKSIPKSRQKSASTSMKTESPLRHLLLPWPITTLRRKKNMPSTASSGKKAFRSSTLP